MCWDPSWDWLVVYASVCVAKGGVADAVSVDESFTILSAGVSWAYFGTLLNFAAATNEVNP